MAGTDAEETRTRSGLQPTLRVVHSAAKPAETLTAPPPVSGEPRIDASPAADLLESLDAAEERARAVAGDIERLRDELHAVRVAVAEADTGWAGLPFAGPALVRAGVLASLAVVLLLTLWAGAVDYARRVTSDTPTFIALVSDMAHRPFVRESPFLDAAVATQHATPYLQLLAFIWRALPGSSDSPGALGTFLALVGIAVFAFLLWCVFLYVRRLAGTTAAWISLPVLLGVFGPPHVIWASDLSLHAALYAGFFPQNLAMATMLLALLALDRRSLGSLAGGCALASLTMLVHPFTGVLLCVLATVDSCRLAGHRDRNALRAPIALAVGFAVGLAWPAYSLDRAFAETGVRGVVFIGLCLAAPLVALGIGSRRRPRPGSGMLTQLLSRLDSEDAAFRLALVGAAGTAAVAAWELILIRHPPAESARLAIYWVDDRWRWPLLLAAGMVGLSGLARLARRGQIVAPVWFVGCFALGAAGAIGLPLPVWYRFLLLCQVPLAVGVATVVVGAQRRTTMVVAGTIALALTVKVGTLLWAPPTVSYFGATLQPVWSLGEHIPPGAGLVATDPATAYFVPATTGRKVLTVDKGHVSSRQELDDAREGYRLLHRYYTGGDDWWSAAQEMWRRGVRYVVVAKQTTLEPRTLDEFIWQTARLQTRKQRDALGNYFYENNRIGTLVFDSADYAIYRIDRAKLFPRNGGSS
jgi:hypothetical protein